MPSRLPLELYDECISYLWDDRQSLSACSLAGRALTVASQKRFFYQITLRNARIILRSQTNPGTSLALHKLLKSSPHIAKYVRCLQIYDIDKFRSDSDVVEAWLTKDTFLPLFSPLLCNIKAFVLFYMPDWNLLSEEVRGSLQHLIRLPSLVYIDIAPLSIWKETIGDNLKHLILRGEGSTASLIQPEPSRSSESPIYLETFFMAKADQSFATRLTSDPDFRFKTSRLRKLALDTQIIINGTFQQFAIGPLLHSCRETLEEFSFTPYIDSLSNANFIDLGQMTALKSLTLYFSHGSDPVWEPMWCFNNLLQSASSTCQRLEDITVFMELYGLGLREWNAICQVLGNPSRCPRLRKFSIHVSGIYPYYDVLRWLENSRSIEHLRARPGMEVVTTGADYVNLGRYAPDKRWENILFE